ncbi:hypothetical protein R6Q59_031619 [Mikania micrantha]
MVKLQQLLGSIRVPKTQKKTPKTAGMRSIYRGLEIRVLVLKSISGASPGGRVCGQAMRADERGLAADDARRIAWPEVPTLGKAVPYSPQRAKVNLLAKEHKNLLSLTWISSKYACLVGTQVLSPNGSQNYISLKEVESSYMTRLDTSTFRSPSLANGKLSIEPWLSHKHIT